MTKLPDNEDASLAAGRAAGYCWKQNPNAAGRCTLKPGHVGPHIDHYNGRRRHGDTVGNIWS